MTDNPIDDRIEEIDRLLADLEPFSVEWNKLATEQAKLFERQSKEVKASPGWIPHDLKRIPKEFID